ncbi:DUF1183-domain-containing protein [Auriscalpium vulgare]|uniref:DUF1183-domain-containing protein n=1 Tax=Auriscalpium vulgare TaxID=40419 RepID=A0ACB8RCM0_9AGAM|nr:DUF1183-domain-containing protein [Auriscalpium vulgare]
MSRVALNSLSSLIFYKDEQTASQRGRPIQQLVCKGSPCRLFTPDVVRCVNLGGVGTEVDWKCEADLPETIRLGRVEVSCEGWGGPGDTDVLKGSCSLEYRLVDVPNALRHPNNILGSQKRWSKSDSVFYLLWMALALFLLYKILAACWPTISGTPRRPRAPPPYQPSPGHDSFEPPPPPYLPKPTEHGSQYNPWAPGGFWTGAAVGGLGAHLLTRQRATGDRAGQQQEYDWEREQRRPPTGWSAAGQALWSRPRTVRAPAPRFDEVDRGEGPSNLGSMRRSAGYGGSNVR